MSKHHHHHYHHPNNQSGGGGGSNFHKKTTITHLDHHHDGGGGSIHSNSPSNGLIRPNGIVNGDQNDSNDTNNNHNKHHKRSAGGGNGEASSSKRTKLSVPSDKNVVKMDGSSSGGGQTRTPQSHYNIMEKLKELYKELKSDKSCKEVR
jgi:hypothetical protein